ncbi:MAG: hypothetical protein CMJ84_03655 [Planctomycetes bacterium]|jgi:hypothetical protein|nr:hypothetical protein [Planctomycetota bacterium]MDP6407793.1 hypothetical protein [Planctomycetota bacterium]
MTDQDPAAADFDDLEPLPVREPEPASETESGIEPAPDAAPAPSPVAPNSGAGERAAERGAPQGQVQKRDLDRAPLVLRKAALVLLAGSILPWGNPLASWGGTVAEKLLCFLAVWLFYQSHILKVGGQVHGLVKNIGRKGPGSVMILAAVVAVIGLIPSATLGAEALTLFKTFTEKAFLLLAGYTFVHIFDYEHGGKFNPMFPLLFCFAAVGGFLSVFTVVPAMGEAGPLAFVALIGTVAVTAAGCMAAYTMIVAMKEAKVHGEAKRAAALEARKAAREARGKSGGAAGSVRRK